MEYRVEYILYLESGVNRGQTQQESGDTVRVMFTWSQVYIIRVRLSRSQGIQ